MNLESLNYFIEVCKQNSLTKAAESLFISQPALSKQMKSLEEQFGYALFHRTHQGIELTEKGQKLYDDLEPHFAAIAHKVEQNQLNQQIRFGSIPSISTYLLPKYLDQLKKLSVEVTVVKDYSKDLLPLLKKQKIDAAILPDPPDVEELYSRFLFHDEIYVAVSTSHPLAEKESITIEECFQYPQLLTPSSTLLYQQVFQLIKEAEQSPIIKEMNYYEMLGYAYLGDGVAYIPGLLAENTSHIGVVFLKLKHAPLSRKMFLYGATKEIVDRLYWVFLPPE
ncbi:LysR family transcriptional regulator [Pontibacillus yanchengensis]|uniref:LysR family transcriptional regulator n=2 Tax=Pontibacillus yanchengensis TaxID=462910 RepID=A0ACC7VGH4_9BACI|nr:LysR family transcriptional regulator [Pontibacillus yanchengensis]MYL35730.1 LysR family transcriptional regulator [Pontibacillus yanchengensis]MYL54553.1 LysR family transcriptional regulator [Pontibacillus yanchengensis]